MHLNATLLIEIISFLLLVGVLTKLLYRPIISILDKRRDYIRNLIENAENDRKKSEEYLQTAKDQLRKTKEEVLQLKEQVSREADKERIKTVEEAKKEALEILKKTELEIKKGIQNAKDEVKKETVSLSVDIAAKILGREINEEDHKRLIKESLKEITREG